MVYLVKISVKADLQIW